MYLSIDKKIYGKSESGIIVFKYLVFDSKTKTYCGILVNPENNTEFNVLIKQTTTESFTFSVNKFIFSKKFTFIRPL